MDDEWRTHSHWPDTPPSWRGSPGPATPEGLAAAPARRRWWPFGLLLAAVLIPALAVYGSGTPQVPVPVPFAAASAAAKADQRSTGLPPSAGVPSAAATSVGATAATQGANLSGLIVTQAWATAGYDRGLFGAAWADVDGNGCDTRNDILRRDLHAVVLTADDPGCVVASGVLDDPYSGTTVQFQRGTATSAAVEIDHVVALADAWRGGAATWTAPQRLAFANDPLNLLATTAKQNRVKGDRGAADWQPPAADFRCPYVSRQVAVKRRYALTVTPQERDAMTMALAHCTDPATSPTRSPTVSPAARSGSSQAGEPSGTATQGRCEPAYPTICLPPAPGHVDLDCGDITERRFEVRAPDPYRLDSDRDGVGCES